MRSKVIRRIACDMQKLEGTQRDKATVLGITQPLVSRLMRCDGESVSLDRLFRILEALEEVLYGETKGIYYKKED